MPTPDEKQEFQANKQSMLQNIAEIKNFLEITRQLSVTEKSERISERMLKIITALEIRISKWRL